MSTKTLTNFVFSIGLAIILVFSAAIQADAPPKIVICHYDRNNGDYERLGVSPMAEGAHFDENGVPGAGHEGDLLLGIGGGECPAGGITEVPEPITMLLFGAGLVGVGYVAKRRKQRA